MITIFTKKDLSEAHGEVTFEEMMIPDIHSIHDAAVADSDIIIYIEGSRIKVLKHPRAEYIESEIPVNMLRPIIMSGISFKDPEEKASSMYNAKQRLQIELNHAH